MHQIHHGHAGHCRLAIYSSSVLIMLIRPLWFFAGDEALTQQVQCLHWPGLAELAIPETGDLDILGGLGAQVCVRGLDGLKHSSDLSG